MVRDRSRSPQHASRLQFVHITKNAGTAVEAWGKQHGYCWGKHWKELRGRTLLPPHEGRLKSEPWHVPPQYFVDNPYRGFDAFAIVRNPYKRIISEFRCRWKGFKAPAMSARKSENIQLRQKATAKELNAWIKQKLSNGAARPPYRNGHLIPQHLYIFGPSQARYVASENVIRFEALQKDCAALWIRHGINNAKPLPVLNESDMKHFHVSDLEEETRRLIEQEYALDFELFGYSKLA
eukprot:TRINITY_DN31502_c0_g1_i1.p1 TRINITY_DN31502_c0_g1~~TRINITY_DN31502_c0_g1_i1.p1  ORF type:complete len:237 (+),score=25.54 TRINITY_DN31502_c0_g1_i1:11-721(+)